MSEMQSTPSFEQHFSKELVPVFTWYKEACAKLPDMNVHITPLKDNKESNVNQSYFSYANVDVTSATTSWQQGGIIQEGNGITVLLTDPEGRTFVTVAQEPLAKAQKRGAGEIHPVVRSPIQTSAEKLNKGTDRGMTTILTDLGADALTNIPLSPASTDGNRMQSDVLYGAISISKEQAAMIAKHVPNGRWATQKELDALTVMGVTNGNLNIARSVVRAQQELSKMGYRP